MVYVGGWVDGIYLSPLYKNLGKNAKYSMGNSIICSLLNTNTLMAGFMFNIITLSGAGEGATAFIGLLSSVVRRQEHDPSTAVSTHFIANMSCTDHESDTNLSETNKLYQSEPTIIKFYYLGTNGDSIEALDN